jgi:hypothetical protein
LQSSVRNVCMNHRYLISRLSLQVFYLWRHVSSTAPPFILWWSNLEILFGPIHRSSPFIGELRCQASQMEHGPYIAERSQKAVYIVRYLWYEPNDRSRSRISFPFRSLSRIKIICIHKAVLTNSPLSVAVNNEFYVSNLCNTCCDSVDKFRYSTRKEVFLSSYSQSNPIGLKSNR